VHAISNDAGRSMMGSRQENWFYRQLKESQKRKAKWRIVGSQTVFTRLNESLAYGLENPLDYDAWDGYESNRNRTYDVLYDNKIDNTIFISGDSHASWVSDLTTLDNYDPVTGNGAIGVEFAGTAVSSPCPAGANISLANANNYTKWLTGVNEALQWSDLYYRGYFELHLSQDAANAYYFGLPTVVTRNNYEISLANFTVKSGANKLQRPIAGGVVESGSVKGGKTVQTNLTLDTGTGQYFISHFNLSVL
jgi:alkaline phosphatase D